MPPPVSLSAGMMNHLAERACLESASKNRLRERLYRVLNYEMANRDCRLRSYPNFVGAGSQH